MNQTYVLSIGLNRRGIPMGPTIRKEISIRINAYLSAQGASVFTRDALGVGEWEGTKEESLTWVFADVNQSALEQFASELATRYDQDAIALVVGQSILCERKIA